jgi:hypothetical protein
MPLTVLPQLVSKVRHVHVDVPSKRILDIRIFEDNRRTLAT